MGSINYEESDYELDLDLLNHLILIVCFISYEKWNSWRKQPFKSHLPHNEWRELTVGYK